METINKTSHAFISDLNPTEIGIHPSVLEAANETLSSTQIPTTRVEAWKYTRVAQLGKRKFQKGSDSVDSIDGFRLENTQGPLVFVNGQFSEALSDTSSIAKGITAQPLSSLGSNALPTSIVPLHHELFHAINTVHLNDGVRITIDKNSQHKQPVHIIHVVSGEDVMANFKTVLHCGAFSEAGMVQSFVSLNDSNGFVNATHEIFVEENAHFNLDKIQNESPGNTHIGTDQVVQDANSVFTINTITLNGGLVRNNLSIEVKGQNCETNLNGAYVLDGKQHVDNHTTVDHKVANCVSNELYKGVIDDHATAVFNGKVFVRQNAQKINAFQSNGNVLLSDSGSVNSKPELEIYADDVRCSHGSTTGQLDEDAIFYLRARGLSEKSARRLLVSAFIGEVIEKISYPASKEYVFSVLCDRFGWNFD